MMKVLNTGAVKRLYHGKYNPAAEPPEENAEQIRGIVLRIGMAFAALQLCGGQETKQLMDAVAHDFDSLRDLEREDAFVRGFRCAAELFQKGELSHAEK